MARTEPQITFNPNATGTTRKQRYELLASRSIECGKHKEIGVGTDQNSDQFLVFEYGERQSGIPMDHVAAAIASGKVVPLDLLVGALAATGKLTQLQREIEKAQKAVGA